MRMPEAGPLGETFFDVSAFAIAVGLCLKSPLSGWVESVLTFADHFFVAIVAAPEDGLLCIHRMRIEWLLSAAGDEKVAEHTAALFGEDPGDDFDAMIELWVIHHGEYGAAGAGFWISGCIDQAGDASVEDCTGAHGTGFERD